MKNTLLILAILSSCSLFAQKVQYVYDKAGNRVQRKTCSACRLANPNTNNFEDEKEALSFEAVILPNPTKGNLEIKITEEEVLKSAHFHVIVFDNLGKQVINKKENTPTFKVDITDKVPGVYFVKVIAGERVKGWNIIKE